MTRTQDSKHLISISQFLSLKLIHFITILILLFLFLYEAIFYTNTEILYALFLILFIPILLFNQGKKEEEDINLNLPYLTKKYRYSKHTLKLQTYSFLIDSFCLFFLQIGNLFFPYENLCLQYAPLILLILRIILRYLLKFVIRSILNYKLMNNLI